MHYWKLDKCTTFGLKKAKGNWGYSWSTMVDNRICLVSKKQKTKQKKGPRQYKSYLHWCINAWMGDILWQNLFKEKN